MNFLFGYMNCLKCKEKQKSANRSRLQIELVFKRFKSIAQLGHLPKHSDDRSKVWLYGKLFTALLTNKLLRIAHYAV